MLMDPHLPRKFLVIVDGTPESRAALRWAERRAHGTSGELVLAAILEPGGFEHWLGVESLMKQEAREEAQLILDNLSEEVVQISGQRPQTHILEGNKIDVIVSLIDSDKTISTLVLASGTDPDGPGPLVSAVATGKSGFHIPVTIVPGELSDEQIDAIT